jgi:hypothetical protein
MVLDTDAAAFLASQADGVCLVVLADGFADGKLRRVRLLLLGLILQGVLGGLVASFILRLRGIISLELEPLITRGDVHVHEGKVIEVLLVQLRLLRLALFRVLVQLPLLLQLPEEVLLGFPLGALVDDVRVEIMLHIGIVLLYLLD